MSQEYKLPEDGELWVEEDQDSRSNTKYIATLVFNNGQTTQFNLASLAQGRAIKTYLYNYKRASSGSRFYGVSAYRGNDSYEAMIDFDLLQMIIIEPSH